MTTSGLVQACDRIRGLCRNIRRNIAILEEENDPNIIDGLVFQFDLLICHLNQMRVPEEVLVSVTNAYSSLVRLKDEEEQHTGIQINLESTNCPGRPRFHITEEQLAHLLQLNFSCATIATMFGVSLRTIRRRMTEYNLSARACYSSIEETELDHAVRELKEEFPNSDYRIMDGLLRQRGIRVKQFQLREAMHRVDPNGVTVRFSDFIQRRKYHVPGPQALWHVDGNHKLIRYCIYMHAYRILMASYLYKLCLCNCTVEYVCYGHLGTNRKCPDYQGVLISRSFYGTIIKCGLCRYDF